MKRTPKKMAKWRDYHKRAQINDPATVEEMRRLPDGHKQTICHHLGVIFQLAYGKESVNKEDIEKIIHHLSIAVIHSKSLSARITQHRLGIR